MKIGCILVTYNPNVELLYKSVDAIYNQVDRICLLDNSPNNDIDYQQKESMEKYTYLRMDGNIGIAAAQNIGLNYFIDLNYDFILFMDQDSIAPDNMVKQLLSDLNFLRQNGINVGAIGPRPINRQRNKEYRGLIKKGVYFDENITEVTELISSASLIPLTNFRQIGLMEASLFIDGVDHEWCWRGAALRNMRFFISERTKLSHQLGEGDHRLLFKNVAISTPFRIFYQFRNYFILIRRGYVPLYWKLINGIKYFIKFFYYPICVSPRKQYFTQILEGVKAGILYRKNK